MKVTIAPVGESLMEQTVALITDHRLPAIYSERSAIAHGGLAFFGVDLSRHRFLR
jgi:hypothetical protein